MATRQLVVEIVGDADSLTRTFARASTATSRFGRESTRSLDRVTRGAFAGSGAFRSLGQSIAFASTSFLGAAGFVAVVRQSIGAASDLSEQMNKVRVVFGAGAAEVIRFSKTTTNALGIVQGEALASAGTFGNMLVPMGFARREAAGMSVRLVKLAADMASFNNADPSDVLDALRSGLAGESEPLRRFGVQLSDARERAILTAAGVKDLGGTLTAQQRTWAAYQLILKDTADAQGDFARTSGGLANQQRILRAQLTQLEARLGKALLPTILQITRGLTDWLSKTENQERVQRTVNTVIQDLTVVARTAARVIRTVNHVTGSFVNTLQLLLALKVASTFYSWATAARVLAASEAKANVAAGGLLTKMGKLKAIGAAGAIVLTVDIVTNFLRSHDSQIAGALNKVIPGLGGHGGINTYQDWLNLSDSEKAFLREHGITQEQINSLPGGPNAPAAGARGPTKGTGRGAGARGPTRGAGSAAASPAVQSVAAASGFTIPLGLRIAEARAGASAGRSDDLAAARAIRAYILRRIPHLHGEKLIQAYEELASVNQEIAADTKKATREAKKSHRATKKVVEVWQQLNTQQLTAGLALTAAQRKALRARLSQIGPGGTVPGEGVGVFGHVATQHNFHLFIDGKRVESRVRHHRKKRKRRNTSQRRGPYAGADD